VVDGDTIHINNPKVGAPSGLEAIGPRPNVRLVGFDAPETWRPVRKAKAMAGDEPERIFQQAIRFYQAQKILESSPNDQREALVPPVCVLAAFTSELMLKCLIRRRACATTCSFGCRACTGPSANRAGTDEHAQRAASPYHRLNTKLVMQATAPLANNGVSESVATATLPHATTTKRTSSAIQ